MKHVPYPVEHDHPQEEGASWTTDLSETTQNFWTRPFLASRLQVVGRQGERAVLRKVLKAFSESDPHHRGFMSAAEVVSLLGVGAVTATKRGEPLPYSTFEEVVQEQGIMGWMGISASIHASLILSDLPLFTTTLQWMRERVNMWSEGEFPVDMFLPSAQHMLDVPSEELLTSATMASALCSLLMDRDRLYPYPAASSNHVLELFWAWRHEPSFAPIWERLVYARPSVGLEWKRIDAYMEQEILWQYVSPSSLSRPKVM